MFWVLWLQVMYATSVQLLVRLLPFTATAVVGQLFIEMLYETTSFDVLLFAASVLIWAYLAFNAHTALLLPEDRDKSSENKKVFGFALRTLGLGIITAIPPALFVAAVVWHHVSTNWEAELGYWTYLSIGIAFGLSFLVTFGLLGTLLPAYVANQGRGLGNAIERGGSQFFWISGHLMAGPMLLYSLSFLMIFVGLGGFESPSYILGEEGLPNTPVLLIMAIAYVIQALGTVMVAWVLSAAFRRAEGLISATEFRTP